MPIGTLIQLIAAGIGIGEQVIPLFIHNPKSQQIEAAIFTTVNNILSAFSGAGAAPAPAPVAHAMNQPLVAPPPAAPSPTLKPFGTL